MNSDNRAIRYSGLRINYMPPHEQEAAWQQRLTDVQWLLPYLKDALTEPYFADDAILDMKFEDIVRYGMQSGELFGCMHGQEVVGFVLLRDIRPNRDAWIEAYTTPAYRGKFPCGTLLRQILEYAFSPWNPELTNSQKYAPKGLGLRKLKAATSDRNDAAVRAMKRLGFFCAGWSLMDALFKGKTTDIILLEKFNPLYIPRQQQDVWKRRLISETPSIHPTAPVSERADLHASPSVQQPGRLQRPSTGSDDATTGGAVGATGRKRINRTRRVRPLAEPTERTDGPSEHAGGGIGVPTESGLAANGGERIGAERKRPGRKQLRGGVPRARSRDEQPQRIQRGVESAGN